MAVEEECIIKSAPDGDPDVKKKIRGQTSEISKVITHSAYSAALNPKQLGDFLDQAGCVCAVDNGLRNMYCRRKDEVKFVGNEQLRANMIENNAAIRAKHQTIYDVIHIDSDEKVHSICSGSVSSDGAEATGAYTTGL